MTKPSSNENIEESLEFQDGRRPGAFIRKRWPVVLAAVTGGILVPYWYFESGWWIVFALAVLALGGYGYWEGLRERKAAAAGISPGLSIPGLIIGVVIFKMVQTASDDQPPHTEPWNQNVVRQRVDVSSMRPSVNNGIRTAVYWRDTVAALHDRRFATPPEDQTVTQHAEQFIQLLRLALQHAQSVSDHDVDPELIRMSKRHMDLDSAYLQLWADFKALQLEQPDDLKSLSAADGFELAVSILNEILADPTLIDRKLPEHVRPLVRTFVELEAARWQQLHDIEIMQARMQERYKGQKFELPSLE